MTQLIIGTRGSRLALTQASIVADVLRRASPDIDVQIKVISTQGDRMLDVPLSKVGDKGLFVKELEVALLTGEIDLAVHSAKDLPSQLVDGLMLSAFLARGEARDALVVRGEALTGLSGLPPGARIGTGSLRRASQLRALRPDLRIEDIRGNVDTRLRKLAEGQFDALVLAAAGMERLGFIARVADGVPIKLEANFTDGANTSLTALPLPTSVMLPAIAQGTLAIESRVDDARTNALVGVLNDVTTQITALAERAFLRRLEGGCQVPIAAYAQISNGLLHIAGLVSSVDGTAIVRDEVVGSAETPEDAGTQLAERLLANGAQAILGNLRPLPKRLPLPPLSGIRIIITRAASHNAGLSARLRELGAEPIEYPVIDYAPPEDTASFDTAMRRLTQGTFDWLVMTSATAVEAIAMWLRANKMNRLTDVHIAAIGPATADACARLLGRSTTLMPDAFSAELLARTLHEARVRGQRALLLNADVANPALQDALADAGLEVDRVIAYRTVAAPANDIDMSALLMRGSAHAITFTSGSTVRHFMDRLHPNARVAAQKLWAVCIGPTTAAAAREAGFTSVVVAETATEDGLIEALIEAAHT